MSAPEDFFAEQFDAIEAFLLDPETSILRMTIDPEMHRMPIRFLEAKDNDPEFRHIVIYHNAAFRTHVHWHDSLLKVIDAQIEEFADVLADKGVDLARLRDTRHPAHQPWKTTLDRLEVLAASLTDYIDSVVVFLDPESVDDVQNWRRTVNFFANTVGVSELKFLIYDARTAPLLDGAVEHPKVVDQCFWLSPEEIEKRAAAQLKGGAKGAALTPAEKCRSLATVGLMAFGREDYATAEKAQRAHLKEAQAAENPTDTALALYNLGNTHLATGNVEEAVEVFSRCADGALYHELDQIAPMAYCNLGIALFRAEEPEQGKACLRVAREMFKAQRNLPGEAYVCDSLALCHHAAGERAEAEKAWTFALKLYDTISNPDLQDVKRGGRYDIKNKMKHFGYAHG